MAADLEEEASELRQMAQEANERLSDLQEQIAEKQHELDTMQDGESETALIMLNSSKISEEASFAAYAAAAGAAVFGTALAFYVCRKQKVYGGQSDEDYFHRV